MTQSVTNSKPQIGARIRQARKDAGLSTYKLAVALGVDPRSVARWQADEVTPSVVRLGQIADVLGKPLSYFIEEAA